MMRNLFVKYNKLFLSIQSDCSQRSKAQIPNHKSQISNK